MEVSQNEEAAELMSNFAAELILVRDVKLSKAGILTVDSERIDHKNIEKFILGVCKEDGFSKYRELIFLYEPAYRAYDVLKRAIKLNEYTSRTADISGDSIFKSFDYTNYRPIISVDDTNNSCFINTSSKKVIKLSHDTYEKYVPKESRKEAILGRVGFNPYRPEALFLDVYDNQKITFANTYIPPEWQLSRELTNLEALDYMKPPRVIERFMETLFPEKDAREFVYDWLHFAITKRCETYLVLNGAKGIGKGIFTDILCKALMGKDNHKLAAPGALESNFNAMLENCRMIVFDEMPINDQDKIAKLKKYINTDQAVERKGYDVGATITTFNSFIISSNAVRDIIIEWDDRRFSVPDLTEKKLDEKWTKEEIKNLIEDINDPSYKTMRQFGYWLMYRIPEGDEFTAYKGKHFFKLCYSSLPEWSRCIVDEITSGVHDILDDVTLKMKFKERAPQGRFPHGTKVEDFLKNYKHEGAKYLGKYEKTENGGFIITVDDEFYSGRDKTGINFVDAGELL